MPTVTVFQIKPEAFRPINALIFFNLEVIIETESHYFCQSLIIVAGIFSEKVQNWTGNNE